MTKWRYFSTFKLKSWESHNTQINLNFHYVLKIENFQQKKYGKKYNSNKIEM